MAANTKILLIEDDHDFRQLVEFDLKKRGYQVVTASDGDEGLQKIQSEKPALVLVDIKMPKVDGYTFVRRVKREEETKDLPVIVLTSFEPMKDMFQMEGIGDYFVKSANMEGLFKTIERNLKENRARE